MSKGPMISSTVRAPLTLDLAFLDEEKGVAALELALVLPLLTTLLLGAADVAITASRARQVEAVAASAALAIRATTDSLLQGVASSMPGHAGAQSMNQTIRSHPQAPPQTDLPLEKFMSLPEQTSGTVRLFFGCPSDKGIAPSAQFRCPNGVAAVPFARIDVSAPSGRLVPWPGQLIPADVSARTVIRLD
ncbi:TadE/TadG family type IV pilus assembly protein [Thermaurantiacus sp.]